MFYLLYIMPVAHRHDLLYFFYIFLSVAIKKVLLYTYNQLTFASTYDDWHGEIY